MAKAIASTMAAIHAVCPLPRPELLAANCGATIHRLAAQKAAAMVAHPMMSVVIATGNSAKRSMLSLNSLRKTACESEVVVASMKNTTSVTAQRIAAKQSMITIRGCEATHTPGVQSCAGLKMASVISKKPRKQTELSSAAPRSLSACFGLITNSLKMLRRPPCRARFTATNRIGNPPQHDDQRRKRSGGGKYAEGNVDLRMQTRNGVKWRARVGDPANGSIPHEIKHEGAKGRNYRAAHGLLHGASSSSAIGKQIFRQQAHDSLAKERGPPANDAKGALLLIGVAAALAKNLESRLGVLAAKFVGSQIEQPAIKRDRESYDLWRR